MVEQGHLVKVSGGAGHRLANVSFPYARPAVAADAETQSGSAALDRRVIEKIEAHPSPRSQQGVSSDRRFTMYPDASADLPIIRNEELILLRAEAAWKTGNLAQAIDDLNWVRTNSGGLPARMDLTADNFQDALLYERRYSIMYEGGYRWLDYRRFNRLSAFTNYPRAGDSGSVIEYANGVWQVDYNTIAGNPGYRQNLKGLVKSNQWHVFDLFGCNRSYCTRYFCFSLSTITHNLNFLQ